jgi:hypothetical protein
MNILSKALMRGSRLTRPFADAFLHRASEVVLKPTITSANIIYVVSEVTQLRTLCSERIHLVARRDNIDNVECNQYFLIREYHILSLTNVTWAAAHTRYRVSVLATRFIQDHPSCSQTGYRSIEQPIWLWLSLL